MEHHVDTRNTKGGYLSRGILPGRKEREENVGEWGA